MMPPRDAAESRGKPLFHRWGAETPHLWKAHQTSFGYSMLLKLTPSAPGVWPIRRMLAQTFL